MFRLLSGEGCLGGGAGAGDVLLNTLEQIEGGARARAVAFRLQPHAHNAVKNESEEADHRMSADAIRQAVVPITTPSDPTRPMAY